MNGCVLNENDETEKEITTFLVILVVNSSVFFILENQLYKSFKKFVHQPSSSKAQSLKTLQMEWTLNAVLD